jgi:hypothetical protein
MARRVSSLNTFRCIYNVMCTYMQHAAQHDITVRPSLQIIC